MSILKSVIIPLLLVIPVFSIAQTHPYEIDYMNLMIQSGRNISVLQDRLGLVQEVYKEEGPINATFVNGSFGFSDTIYCNLSKERIWHRIQEVAAITYRTEILYEDYKYGRMLYAGSILVDGGDKIDWWPTWIDMINTVNFSTRFYVAEGAIKIDLFRIGYIDSLFPLLRHPGKEKMKDAHRVISSISNRLQGHVNSFDIWIQNTEIEDQFILDNK